MKPNIRCFVPFFLNQSSSRRELYLFPLVSGKNQMAPKMLRVPILHLGQFILRQARQIEEAEPVQQDIVNQPVQEEEGGLIAGLEFDVGERRGVRIPR